MKMYNITEVGEKFGLSKSAIRYYDDIGLIPDLKRDQNGTRIFDASNINMIQSIECLKKTGMPVKDIKKYVALIQAGDSTLETRLDVFKKREKIVLKQIQELQETLSEIKWKCDYYQIAIDDGTEKIIKAKAESDGV